MAAFINQVIPPPADWQAFERLCADLWGKIWNDEYVQLNGRQGKPQWGVDVFGKPNKGNYYEGIQCKGKNGNYGQAVSADELRAEVNKAKEFRPPIKKFILATTAPNDPKIQQVAREITLEHQAANLFDVEVLGWEEIQRRLGDYVDLIRKHSLGLFIPEERKPLLFKDIDTALERSGEFFPQKLLFSKNILYFLSEEKNIIDKICSILTTNDGERLSLLTGAPATGKTVIAISIGKKFQAEGYQVYYYNLRQSSMLAEVRNDILTCDNEKSFVILDDCHLNISIANEIYYNFDTHKNIACLMIARDIPEELRTDYENHGLDIFSKLDANERLFNLTSITRARFDNKIMGIIETYKKHIEQENGVQLLIGNENTVIKNVHGNLLKLWFSLAFWTTDTALSTLDQAELNKALYRYYYKPLSTPDEANLLLTFASVYQYEVKCEAAASKKQIADSLAMRGYVYYEDDTGCYTFQHGDFARLLVEAAYSRPENNRHYAKINAFILSNVVSYIRTFPLYPSNLHELILGLIRNKERRIFRSLLTDSDISFRIASCYKNKAQISDIIDFLFKVKVYLTPAQVSFYINHIVFNNPSFNKSIKNSDKPLLYYVKLFKTLYRGEAKDYQRFESLFSDIDKKQFAENSPFYLICYSIRSLQEADSVAAANLFSLSSVNTLLAKAREANLSDVFNGLKHIYRFDQAKGRELFRAYSALDDGCFVGKDEGLRFEELTDAISWLNNIDEVSSNQLFSKISLSVWTNKMQRASLAKLAFGLSVLKNVNLGAARRLVGTLDVEWLRNRLLKTRISIASDTLAILNLISPSFARRAFMALDTEKLLRILEHNPIENIGKSLSEFSKLNKERTVEILKGLDFQYMFKSVRDFDIKKISKALSEINKIDSNVAQAMYASIDQKMLLDKFENTALEGLGRSLCEFNNINSKHTKLLYASMNKSVMMKKVACSTLVQIGHSLTEMNTVDAVLTKEFYLALPMDTLMQKLHSEEISFQKLGNLASQLKQVDDATPRRTQKLMLSLDLSIYLARGRQAYFSELCAGLDFLERNASGLGKKIVAGLGISLLERKFANEKFEKLGPAMKQMSFVDSEAAEQLWQKCSLSDLSKKALLLPINRLSNTLDTLWQSNRLIARKILTSLDVVVIARKMLKSSRSERDQAIKRFERIDINYTKSLRTKNRGLLLTTKNMRVSRR